MIAGIKLRGAQLLNQNPDERSQPHRPKRRAEFCDDGSWVIFLTVMLVSAIGIIVLALCAAGCITMEKGAVQIGSPDHPAVVSNAQVGSTTQPAAVLATGEKTVVIDATGAQGVQISNLGWWMIGAIGVLGGGILLRLPWPWKRRQQSTVNSQ